MPHEVNEIETSRKDKAYFPENFFSLISYFVFSDPISKPTSCLGRILDSRSA